MARTEAGRLCVSVIEARNVQADTSSGLNFYVKIRVGLSQAKTDIATNSASPKFLKDLRLSVDNPSTDTLQVELMQQGQRGDLVIGKESLRIASVMDKGTLVTWLPLTSMDGDCAAELCLVMRYLQANSSRPMTPSYAIASREARQRALDESGTEPGMLVGPSGAIRTGVSKALFTDLAQPIGGAEVLAPGTPVKHGVAATTASPATPANADSPATSHASTAISLSSTNSSPTYHRLANTAEPASTADRNKFTGTVQQSAQVASQQGRGARRRAGNLPGLRLLNGLAGTVRSHASKAQLPVPAVMAVGSVLGAILYLAKLRPAPEGSEGDAPCAVGACFRQDVYDRYRSRYSTF